MFFLDQWHRTRFYLSLAKYYLQTSIGTIAKCVSTSFLSWLPSLLVLRQVSITSRFSTKETEYSVLTFLSKPTKSPHQMADASTSPCPWPSLGQVSRKKMTSLAKPYSVCGLLFDPIADHFDTYRTDQATFSLALTNYNGANPPVDVLYENQVLNKDAGSAIVQGLNSTTALDYSQRHNG